MSKSQTNETTAIENADMEFGDEHIIEVSAPTNTTDKAALREQKLKAISFNEIERAKSKDLVGKIFDIVDGVRAAIKGEPVATFIIMLDGKKRAVSKPLNTYTNSYIEYFELFEKDETVTPLTNYTFVELDSGGEAGNRPVVLRKL